MSGDDCARHIAALFGPAFDAGLHACLWFDTAKTTQWHQSVEPMVESAMKARANVYCGMGMRLDPPKKGRGQAGGVDAIVGMWADVDIAGEVHEKPGLPVDEDAAKAIILEIGLRPTILYHTGGGLQAQWLFAEPWLFGESEERADAASFCARFGATVRAVAKRHGCVTDSVHDLSRVMRVAGTTNRKYDPHRPVVIIDLDNHRRYLADHFDEIMVAEEFVSDTPITVSPVDHLTIRPDADIDRELLGAVLAADRQFADTYYRRRTDLADQSASGYDMALSHCGVSAGWSDQRIADLMISARRRFGDEIKKHLRYYQLTIGKARSQHIGERAVAELDAVRDETPKPSSNGTERKRILDKLSQALGVPIVKWQKQGEENASFSIVLADGTEVLLGSAENVLNQIRVRARIFDATGVIIREVKKTTWYKICEKLQSVVTNLDNLESSRSATALGWVQAYIPSQFCHKGEEWARALPQNFPFEKDGKIYVNAQAMRRWLRVDLGENVDRSRIWDYLRVIGFENVKVTGRVDGRTYGRSYWSAPMEVMEQCDIDQDGVANEDG